ncbi:Vgb family protein [Chelatococcus reniformis]|uniref:SMP-30/Gluconolactonase/LRE-like region domain-containing protein n=1 Tax=Chelatococcus reniformis TaxID=1494448 RepID=A0A916XPA7_9HYPH|nr:SMP-30/gluconolactonase/LRE family protein [Chelatococcus reniformis]GGC88932.1 hypothetical protein GCM10010994_53560 [Chelatococcus reniformis]
MAGAKRAVAAIGIILSSSAIAGAANYKAEVLVPGSAFHGVHGLAVDQEGRLLAGSVVGQAVYEVDRGNGTAKVVVGPPMGMADDIAVAPDGTIAWTGFLTGDLYTRKGDGPILKVASGLPGLNSLAYRKDGRLYATQVFLGDALYEIDTKGEKPPRKIMENMGGLNGFEFGPDGLLYGPLWFKGQVAKVDVDKPELTVVADGFKVPAAANFDSKGNLYVIDTNVGELVRVDPGTGQKTAVAKLKTALDNLAIDSSDKIYVSNMADNGIQEVDPATGAVKQVIAGKLAVPGGLAVTADGGRETLHVADVFAYRSVDGGSGAVKDVARVHSDDTPLEYPVNISVNKDHAVLSSWSTGTVQVFDRQTGKRLEIIHKLQSPGNAVELPGGGLLVAEIGTGSLLKMSGEHGSDRKAVATGLAEPVGLVVTEPDTAYVTEASGGQLTRVDLATGAKTVVAKGLQRPEGLAAAPDGTLIVAEAGARRLVAVDPRSGQTKEIVGGLPVDLPAPAGIPSSFVPVGVAVGPSGTIYVTSNSENAIYKVTKK